MNNWINININEQNIEIETEKAILIKMPNNSEYSGYKFWHPSKLVRLGRNRNSMQLSFTKEFNFKLKKYGKGKYNFKEVISEVEITGAEMAEIFEVIDKNITAKKCKQPVVLNPGKEEVLDDLKDE